MPIEQPRAVRETRVAAGRARLYVRDVGEGWPIIVIHGGPDFDHSYFLPDLDLLADSYRLIYYDQRGRGRSSAGVHPEDVTIESEAGDLDLVREAAGLETVVLLGHSWGGLLAMEYAVRHPDHVSHLVLMNTGPASHARAVSLRRELARRKSPEEAATMAAIASTDVYKAGDLGADAAYYRIHFGTTLRRPDLLQRLLDHLRRGSTPDGIILARQIEEHLYEQTWSVTGYDLTPQLQQLVMPTLLIHGDDDFVPIDVARDIANTIPDSRLVVLDGCGHFSYMEQPDRVRACLDEFITH
ncbi:MAG TPA: alpha/beta fold hydrolase [Ilumatobacteraceae bacterium]